MFMSKFSKVLIITTSGGSGILQGARAKREELEQEDPSVMVIQKDLMIDFVGKNIGLPGVALYNRTQQSGNVFFLQLLFNMRSLLDIFWWVKIFYSALRTLFKEDIDRVIDMQPVGTSAVIKAIRFFNRIKGKNIVMEKFFVDLPSKKNTHYFRNIRKLSKQDRKYLRVFTIKPFVEEGETNAEFWKKHCNLEESSITYYKYPLRSGFKSYIGMAKKLDATLGILVKNLQEKLLIEKIASLGSINVENSGENKLEFKIGKEDKLYVIILGSQPSREATVNYVKNFMNLVRTKLNKMKKYHLFVFCADHEDNKQDLFNKIYSMLSQEKEYPKNFSVVPMSFQPDYVIASLYNRSDLTITRSGGQTIMELIEVAHGHCWVHSEAKNSEEIFSGIPSWEGGNIFYLNAIKKGQIITPFTLEQMVLPEKDLC
jgi:UDP-N-acetylglucosamine:LPS N-acetylglucosamine transferase